MKDGKNKITMKEFFKWKKIFLEFSSFYSENIYPLFRIVFFIISFSSILILGIEYGIYYPEHWNFWIQIIIRIIVFIFLSYEILNLFFYRKGTIQDIYQYFAVRKVEIIIALFVLLLVISEAIFIQYLSRFHFLSDHVVLFFLSISQFLILINSFFHFSRNISNIRYKKISPSMILLLSFIGVIIIGTILLSLPKAQFRKIDFVDVVFTVVSATCVTGLSTIDIGKDLTLGGQIILLILIQIGGLGLMTLTSFFSFYFSGQVSLTNQIIMRELFSEISLEKVKKILRDIAIFTFSFELLGAIYLYFSLPDVLIPEGKSKFFYAIFHSISAFCNAGFSLFSDSLHSVAKYSYISIYGIMFLIILGGLGFPVIQDLITKFREKRHRFSLTTKIVLWANGILWIASFFVFIFFNFFYQFHFSTSELIMHGLFFSITPRTAGFNTFVYNTLPLPMIFFTFLLMWIGASPISTGGGIKTTTITIAFLHVLSLLRGETKVQILDRKINRETIIRAYSNVLLSLMTIFVGIFLLTIFESTDFLKITFEVVSAYGTVGLSMGITSDLHVLSKWILCFIMLTGRIGILSLLLAIIPKAKNLKYEYPTEYVVVG